jgi:hypothetical protein
MDIFQHELYIVKTVHYLVRVNLCSNTLKCLPLSFTDFHSKHEFARKSSSEKFEGSARIWWTQLNPAYKDSFPRASNFRC